MDNAIKSPCSYKTSIVAFIFRHRKRDYGLLRLASSRIELGNMPDAALNWRDS